MFTGQCMCGQVRYEVHGPLRDVIACHCAQCRRASSHYVAATAAHPKDLDDHLRSGSLLVRGHARHPARLLPPVRFDPVLRSWAGPPDRDRRGFAGRRRAS